jgi:hypothetical protein
MDFKWNLNLQSNYLAVLVPVVVFKLSRVAAELYVTLESRSLQPLHADRMGCYAKASI